VGTTPLVARRLKGRKYEGEKEVKKKKKKRNNKEEEVYKIKKKKKSSFLS